MRKQQTNFLVRLAKRATKGSIRALAYGLVGGLLILVVGFVLYLNSKPEPKVWHKAQLDTEFRATLPVHSFEDYLALENRLFAQLDEKVYAKIETKDKHQINRYHHGSLSDPSRWPTNWNRSFELPYSTPSAGVLLLHGMSDSPYSLRSLGQRLNAGGAWVVGLRVPGHGTVPSGLVHVQWEDMASAVRLAMHHLHKKVGERPLYIVGYSNGGALAVLYTLSALEDTSLALPDRLVLISPEIGVTKLAALAAWQERLGHLLGLRKLSWNSIGVEYDPFKYQSFALNAGKQAYRLTAEIQSRMTRLVPTGALTRFPPVLAFQSVVDATVSVPALVQRFFEKLPQGEHELVLFDINLLSRIEPVLKSAPREEMATLLRNAERLFALTLVTNENENSRKVIAKHWRPGDDEGTVSALDLAWPDRLYSLSHVALPFPEDDPLYGHIDTGTNPGIRLGNLAPRGERGILRISAADMLRLRWNPFYTYLERRVLEFTRLEARSQDATEDHVLSEQEHKPEI